jgi:hypothetical protein
VTAVVASSNLLLVLLVLFMDMVSIKAVSATKYFIIHPMLVSMMFRAWAVDEAGISFIFCVLKAGIEVQSLHTPLIFVLFHRFLLCPLLVHQNLLEFPFFFKYYISRSGKKMQKSTWNANAAQK